MKLLLTIRNVTQIELLTEGRQTFAPKTKPHRNRKAYRRSTKHKENNGH